MASVVRTLSRVCLPPALLCAALIALLLGPAAAQEEWSVVFFDATYTINADASVQVTEDIIVDFGSQPQSGIERRIQTEFDYVPSPGEGLDPGSYYELVYGLEVQSVDHGEQPVEFETSQEGQNLVIQVGDSEASLSGENRYRISYVVSGAFTSRERWDEFFWNATGNSWQVPIESAKATVRASRLIGSTCAQGPLGSDRVCKMDRSVETAIFRTTEPLSPGGSLFFGVATPRGMVDVAPENIVRIELAEEESSSGSVAFLPLTLAGAAVLAVIASLMLARYRWVRGRRP